MTMMDPKTQDTSKGSRRHARLVLSLAGMVVGMFALAYAAVPLYEIFCRVTGYGGTTQRAEKPSEQVLEQRIKVKFDANLSRDMGWHFTPVTRALDVKIGETGLAFYQAANPASKPLAGTATFNVTPEIAGSYFNKIECFCFTEQVLQPGESVDMPVTFFIDPDIVKDPDAKHVTEITLSYTFFPVKKAGDMAAAKQTKEGS